MPLQCLFEYIDILKGVGEYVLDPARAESRSSAVAEVVNRLSLDPSLFSISGNAIVLNIADPFAIEQAVLLLEANPRLASLLGVAGFQTVQKYFTLEMQLEKYDMLYKSLLL